MRPSHDLEWQPGAVPGNLSSDRGVACFVTETMSESPRDIRHQYRGVMKQFGSSRHPIEQDGNTGSVRWFAVAFGGTGSRRGS